jgi:hypothetical protein
MSSGWITRQCSRNRCAVFLVAAAIGIASTAVAQAPATTWARTKPVLDRWTALETSSHGSVAAQQQIRSEILQLLSQHSGEAWAYETSALGYNNCLEPVINFVPVF